MGSKTLIVSFAGHGLKYGGVPKIEFANFLQTHFSHIDAQFYIDNTCSSYHHGIEGISTNIDETVQYLRQRFEGYDKIITLGASAGGYAAILFGSLLNVDTVIAFIPQTILKSKDREDKYRNLAPFINPDTTYHIFGDTSITDTNNYHHISQCENIAQSPNVKLNRMQGVNMKHLKYTGQLLRIFKEIVDYNIVPIKMYSNWNKFPQVMRFLP
jgi:hypothetical protein